jgi:ADP-ribose pyrophosphatase YjhB (NUDIX family)
VGNLIPVDDSKELRWPAAKRLWADNVPTQFVSDQGHFRLRQLVDELVELPTVDTPGMSLRTAPKANSIVPSATAVVTDDTGRILMVHKTDNDLWALPGGGMDLGESIADAAVRETKEETGIDVEVTGLIGVYTNPRHVLAYDDGEVRQQFSLCFTTRMLGGTLRTSGETSEVRFVSPADFDGLNIHPSMRLRIDHYREHRPEPYIG